MSYEELDDIIHEAVLQGRTVELTDSEGYGYQIEIDGTPLLANGEGINHETFGYPIDSVPINREATEIAEEMLRDHVGRGQRNRMRRLRTGDHCAAHGEVLPIDG